MAFEAQLQQISLINEEVRSVFGSLAPDELNWKPHPQKWSIGQQFDHLMTTNGLYFPIFESIIRGEYRPSLWARISPLSGLFGRMLVNSMGPESKRKIKTATAFEPSASQVKADIVADFLTQQQQLSQYMEALSAPSQAKIIITSPASGFITYSLQHAVELLVVHEKRHIAQARSLLKIMREAT